MVRESLESHTRSQTLSGNLDGTAHSTTTGEKITVEIVMCIILQLTFNKEVVGFNAEMVVFKQSKRNMKASQLTGILWSFLPLWEEATWARYWITFLVFSVFPAPDSPLQNISDIFLNNHFQQLLHPLFIATMLHPIYGCEHAGDLHSPPKARSADDAGGATRYLFKILSSS